MSGHRQWGRPAALGLGAAAVLAAALVNLLPWVLALWGSDPARMAEEYRFLFFVHLPALLVLEPLSPPAAGGGTFLGDFLLRHGGTLGGRLEGAGLLLGAWLPAGLLVGALLAGLGWSRESAARTVALRRERRLLLRGFGAGEALFWLLFLAATPAREVEWLNILAFWLALPGVKLCQVYLAARAALALGLGPGKAAGAGILAGCVLVYWLAFLLLAEEFSRREEALLARAAHRPEGPP